MKEDYIVTNVRLKTETVEQLKKFRWAPKKSEAIRLILEGFFLMSPEEQTAFLKKAAEQKFSLD